MQIKDVMLEGLEKVIQRGEQLETLQQKTDEIKTQSRTIYKKSKKMNSWWANLGCGCGGPKNDQSRGMNNTMQTMKLARKANQAKQELNYL
mmetsp:Transcript_10056/g.15346  ORF Transcript_10056/g.15346 Transcript_10056/m.15346 type:complete len:91 (+) Transcript_10056:647-919(+)